ncbi:MAG TPA: GTPase HflX [Thermoanaerobaculia bacterium]|nr:GTPase HflX [Thermoanaerobaculia bacterium]
MSRGWTSARTIIYNTPQVNTLKKPLQKNAKSDRAPGRRALLVGVVLPGQPGFVVEEHLDELRELASSAGVAVVGRAVQGRKAPDAATFVGSGKAEEIAAQARLLGAELLIFDDDLSGSQWKNLEQATELSVLDRSSLILDLFGQRARTREARTQVELARLNYMLPRLTRRWGHLSRQAGGVGTRGGEGEKQIEQDRRQLRHRIRRLEDDLKKIERTRGVQRHGRRGVPEVALTGYTNAGKSTLWNRLTGGDTLAENRLFATLDAKLRRGVIGALNGNGDGGVPETAVFADTVGFIRKLPHHLVSSFRSTLGEITAADLVLHVVDRSHPRWREQAEVAEKVLADLGVEPGRVVLVFNKSDLVEPQEPRNGGLWVSATTGEGIPDLREEIASRLDGRVENVSAATARR